MNNRSNFQMSTSKSLFSTTVTNELLQIRNALDSNDSSLRKKAAKRCVALMRAGENVGSLFSSMLRCVKTDDLELKRLTYLYLVTYSPEQSEEAIMAVNTFIIDSEDGNPLVRALSVRTMGKFKIEAIAEHMVIPIKQRLNDKDPYVRKTAALAVAKLFDTIPESVENSGAFEILKKMLRDSNPMVVSNAASAICEINSKRATPIFSFSDDPEPILSAISSSTEWCQINLFDILSKYEPKTPEEAEHLIDRLLPFLKHANAAVVIGAFKCIFLFMEYSTQDIKQLFSHIIPPFLSLVSGADPEIQYIVLRTLSLFVLKYPKALSKEIRIFFCKFNDPSYVKIEKLDIILTICTIKNINLVISELAEYCNSIDVGFVKKSIRCLGQIAIKIPESAPKCVDVLVNLMTGHADYAIEESIIVVVDLLRTYPGKFESIIEKVCTNIDHVKDSHAKASLIWILGEYCGLFEKIDLIIDPFLDTFSDESPEVQIQIITAMVKIFLTRPQDSEDQLQFVLTEATKETFLPDVRNRALTYWRLLSADSDATRKVVIFDKKPVKGHTQRYTDEVLDELLRNMGSVSGVLRMATTDFVQKKFMPDAEESDQRDWTQVYSQNGLIISCDFDDKKIYFNFENTSEIEFSNFALALNKNIYGFTLVSQPGLPEKLSPNSTFETNSEYFIDKQNSVSNGSDTLQFALRVNQNIAYFNHIPDTRRMGVLGFRMKKKEFLEFFSKKQESITFAVPVQQQTMHFASNEELVNRKIHIVCQKEDEEMCLAIKFGGNLMCIADIEKKDNQFNFIIKCDDALIPLMKKSAQYTFL